MSLSLRLEGLSNRSASLERNRLLDFAYLTYIVCLLSPLANWATGWNHLLDYKTKSVTYLCVLSSFFVKAVSSDNVELLGILRMVLTVVFYLAMGGTLLMLVLFVVNSRPNSLDSELLVVLEFFASLIEPENCRTLPFEIIFVFIVEFS